MGTYTPEQFKRKLERFAQKQPAIVQRALKAATEIVRTEAVSTHLSGPKMARGRGSRKNATLQPGTGGLRQSVHTRVNRAGGKLSGRIIASKKYARIHEEGGVIRAKGNGYLKFKYPGGFAQVKEVRIPARPYLSSSLEAKRQQVAETILKFLMQGYKQSG